MRIAYLCSDPGIAPDGTKGAAVHFREFGAALSAAGAELDVFMARVGHDPAAARIVPPKPGSGASRELRQLGASAAMLEALECSGPHDAVYERLSLFGVAGLAYARARGIPLLLEVNAPLWEEAARYRSLELVHGAHALALDVLHGAHAVFAVSPELRRRLVAEGVAPLKVHVLPNGVNQGLFDAAPPMSRPAALTGRPALAFVGSLKKWHGVEFLLAAWTRLRARRDVGLWVVGDGPLADLVRAHARAWPDALVCQGAVRHEEVPAVLKAADVALAPYPADAPGYFSPLKVVEALGAGCPLAASRVPCVTAFTEGEDRVEWFTPGDADDFARAVLALLERWPRPQSGWTSRAAAYSWELRARTVLALALAHAAPAPAPGGASS